MTKSPFSPFFLETGQGRRFAVYHPAQTEKPSAALIYVAPFAEEMNCSRRVVAAQARKLAQAGFAVLQMDLFGCGDSEGEFADATVPIWLEDLNFAFAWLDSQVRCDIWWWGLRSGALLAMACAKALAQPANFFFWQPVLSGELLVRDFLRMKIIADQLAGRTSRVNDYQVMLSSGRSVEAGGYVLSAVLAGGLQGLNLGACDALQRVRLIELGVPQETDDLSPGIVRALENWHLNCTDWRVKGLPMPPFWSRVGRDCADPLHDVMIKWLREVYSDGSP